MPKWMPLYLLAASLLQGQAASPEESYRKALQLQSAGRTGEAVEQYKAYLAQAPDRVEAIANLGSALVELGRLDEAIEQYRLALVKDPQNPGVRLNLALALYRTGELPAASSELAVLHDAFPDNLRVNELLADCYLRQGEHRKLIDLLTPFQAQYPGERSITCMLGMALIREDRFEEGERMMDLLGRGGNAAESRLLAGMMKLRGADLAGAREEFLRATALNPKLAAAWSLYGVTLREIASGAMDDATADAFRRALDLDPNDYDANLALGTKVRQEEKYEEAIPRLTRAAQIRPHEPEPLYQLAAAHFGQGHAEQARKELESLIRNWPSFLEARATLTAVYYKLGRKQDGDRESAILRKLKADARPKP
ncbi:MAG: tetratricopeptide repeat protein [Acidobacteriota bacterium]